MWGFIAAHCPIYDLISRKHFPRSYFIKNYIVQYDLLGLW